MRDKEREPINSLFFSHSFLLSVSVLLAFLFFGRARPKKENQETQPKEQPKKYSMRRPLYAENLLMTNPFAKGWAPCFDIYPAAKRDGAIIFCHETKQVREVPKQTIMTLDARRYLGGFELYCYNLYLSVNLQYYTITKVEPLSWSEFKSKYCQKINRCYVTNR